jgi:hypothetical protein
MGEGSFGWRIEKVSWLACGGFTITNKENHTLLYEFWYELFVRRGTVVDVRGGIFVWEKGCSTQQPARKVLGGGGPVVLGPRPGADLLV